MEYFSTPSDEHKKKHEHDDAVDSKVREVNLEVHINVSDYKRNKWLENMKQWNISSGIAKLLATLMSHFFSH